MGEFLITFCILGMILFACAGGKAAAGSAMAALKPDPSILDARRRINDRHVWKPELENEIKGKFEVADAYYTRSNHCAIELHNLLTGERYTVYACYHCNAIINANLILITWRLQELGYKDKKTPLQLKTGDRVVR